jgi:hypothetical protein
MRSAARDSAKALLVLLVWLGLIDLGLHAMHVPVMGSSVTPDARRCFRLRPGAQFWLDSEGRNLVRINALGLDDREHTLQRPAGTLRVAFLGSSIVEAQQVPPGKRFQAVVERELRRSGKMAARDVEALNFGVAAYSLPQQWITLHDEVWKYDPQIVIEVIGLYNDIVNSDRYTTANHATFPYYTAEDGRLKPDEITLEAERSAPDPNQVKWAGRMNDLMNYSKLLLLLNSGIRSRLLGQEEWQPGPSRRPGHLVDPGQMATFYPPSDPHLQNAWNVSEVTLKLMRDECLAHHAEFWVVISDIALQSDPDPQSREQQARNLGITDLHYPDRRIFEWTRSEGIASMWLAPELADYAERHQVYLHRFFNAPNSIHYNLLGHEVIGGMIASRLTQGSERLKAGVN